MTATLITEAIPDTTAHAAHATRTVGAGTAVHHGARRVVAVGAISGIAAAAAATVVAVVAKAADVSMKAAPRSAEVGKAIPMSGFAVSTVGCVAIGVVLALALRRWAKRPAATFTVVTLVLTGLSFFGPVTTGHATMATRLVLSLTHVVAAAIVIPAMARTLPDRRAGA
jgi:hypothetical protein